MSSTRQTELTEEQRRMYASEKLDNFRWISKLVATRSSYTLTDSDRAPESLHLELADLGQFAELVYSAIPVPFLLDNYDVLSQPDFPLENHIALKGLALVDFFQGKLKLPVCIVHRPTTKQVVVAIAGTSLPTHALHDVYAIKSTHPSRKGAVHTGFWTLYMDIKDRALDVIRRAVSELRPSELVLTGHSMGGSLSYLLCMDILSDEELVKAGIMIKIAVFGAPRTGDEALVRYFHDLVSSYRQRHGDDFFKEYAVKGYNDGVPALPPYMLGYRHFCRTPIYTSYGNLYTTPASESEHALFTVVSDKDMEGPPLFPRGGHNYYNGRDLERFSRRIKWLHQANPHEEGWEDRYRATVHKHCR
ncbi:hypothetical protein CVT24_000294 [Panaeolus cyanescens]|uniref:Fungal lipase-type domain-containing protein n=1 Tax=Panaeolus cyanescens TaxID=181874 RepID=A0A409W388_9AGAR|nr:hypothetical protein CVT24_000294 [Panaeolus cyanescens]